MNTPHTTLQTPLDAAQTKPAHPTTVAGTLSVGLLIALVVGSILGSGIFGLPQNMASGAGAGAIVAGVHDRSIA